MSRLYCPKCKEYANDHKTNPISGKPCCIHCSTQLIDWDEIDRFMDEIRRV